MATFKELMGKVTSGTATAEDLIELGKLASQEGAEKKKIEETALKFIADIKKAKIDPQVLTNMLIKEDLIIIPKPVGQKTIILEDKVAVEGKDYTLKIWAGRPLKTATGSLKDKWQALKIKGKDHFVAALTEDGKEFYKTEEGKKYIDNLFM